MRFIMASPVVLSLGKLLGAVLLVITGVLIVACEDIPATFSPIPTMPENTQPPAPTNTLPSDILSTNAPTPTSGPCTPPAGWQIYVVQPGDTLAAIAQAHNVDWKVVADINRLSNPDVIQVGQKIYVPGSEATLPATDTPLPPPTPVAVTPSYTPTPSTGTPVLPTDTPIPPSPTGVPPTPTNTPRPPTPPSVVTDTPFVPPTRIPTEKVTHTPLPPL